MNRVFIKNIKQHVGKEVMLKGWVYSFRRSGKIEAGGPWIWNHKQHR